MFETGKIYKGSSDVYVLGSVMSNLFFGVLIKHGLNNLDKIEPSNELLTRIKALIE
jgi:hypothetical protein